jgi:hypothetical protein
MRGRIIVYLYVQDLRSRARRERDPTRRCVRSYAGETSGWQEIKFVKDTVDNTITHSQKGWINKIIEATGMTDCNPNWTPARRKFLLHTRLRRALPSYSTYYTLH